MSLTTLTSVIPEGTTALYRFTLVDEEGATVDASVVTALTLTYWDVETNTIINGREDMDVRNTNDVELGTEGGITTIEWVLQPADTVILNQQCSVELHMATFAWTWDQGRRIGRHTIRFLVENLAFVPI